MARASRNKKSTIRLNFNDIETSLLVEEGAHPVEIAEVSVKDGDAGQYLAMKLKVTDGDSKGGIFYNNQSLAPQSWWAVKNLLDAIGYEYPEGDFDLDPAELVGGTFTAHVAHEEWDGKMKARLSDFSALRSKGKKKIEEDEEEVRPAKKGKRQVEEEEEDEDVRPKASRGSVKKKKASLTSELIMDMDSDELESVVTEHELDVDLEDFRTLGKKRNAVIDAATEAGLIEE